MLFFTGYVVCCLVGQQLSFPGVVPFVTFWPASGLCVAVLTLAERRDWPRLIAVAIGANLVFNLFFQQLPVGLSLWYCAANTAEAVVGSGLLRAFRRRAPEASRLHEFMALVGAGILGSLCGASIAILATFVAGNGAGNPQWWVIWWSADMVGILLAGPAVLSWWSESQISVAILRSRYRVLELSILLGLMVLRTSLAGRFETYTVRSLPLGVLPLLVWAAVRFGTRGVSLALVLVIGGLVQATIAGRGMFALGDDSPEVRVIFLQFATGLLGFSFLSLAAVIDDRNRALEIATAARAMAERANAAKSLFLANMSHELRTPLNGILGMTELVLGSELTRTQRERVGLVRSSAESLLSLINDILDLAKVEAGRLELRPVEFSLRVNLQDVVSLIGPQAQSKGVELVCQINPDVPDALRADNLRLRQVLLNLLGNAVKFTHDGRVQLDVDVASISGPQRVLQFCVSDTGIGIAQEARERIFLPFGQGHSDNQYAGTGLGLSIVRQLVSLMGGRVWVDSEPGRGSRFWFTMPAVVVDSAPPQAASFPATQRVLPIGTTAADPPPDARKPVLLVEDDPTSALLARTVLENAGYTVTLAENGAQAVQLWTSGQYSLVLSDMRMPVMNGLELAREIRGRESPSAPRTPFVLLTASGHEDEHHDCLAAGVDAYLVKPLRSDKLLAVIKDLSINRRPGR